MDLSSAIPYYIKLSVFQGIYMTLAWVLCIVLKNGSMVDFAWPSGFLVQALYFYFIGDGELGYNVKSKPNILANLFF